MNSTRPKSSKGRSRPPADHTVRDTREHVQSDHHLAVGHQSDGCIRSRSDSLTGITTPQGQDYTATPLQSVPARQTLSLNKYKVLPSIKKPSDVSHALVPEMKTSKIKLCDHVIAQQRRHSHGEPGCYAEETPAKTQTATRSNPEIGRVAPAPNKPPDPVIMESRDETPAVVATDQLLLAIRAPCGRRFQQHFSYADTLQTLITCAEARNETSYSEAFIETMDVPRRSFRRLDMTLSECCIFNRSVLCISQERPSDIATSVVDNG
ncbi:UBX domain-containing protein 10 [Gadus chalcogrammus]|uniref:UBX domain-containing protein 10 n=1 Tax=Gadus chalcogrammus TaxID=1042646 RepID=UPI0024C25337|nr:UBX domain-containing protein 10 [Gadus chalcogrammus]